MKLPAVAAAAAIVVTSLGNAAPLSNAESCKRDVEKAEALFHLCMTQGVVVDADGSPGTYGTGCTMDHVVEFAGAYATVLHCATAYTDAPSIHALRDFREVAKAVSSPASQKRLQAATKEAR